MTTPTPILPNVPRGAYAWAMVGATVAGVAVGYLTAVLIGGSGGGSAPTLAAATILAVSVFTFLPVLVPSLMKHFGVMVAGAGMARMLTGLAIGLVMTALRDVPKQPFWLAIAAGLVAVLITETTTAMVLLARRERQRSSPTAPAAGGMEAS